MHGHNHIKTKFLTHTHRASLRRTRAHSTGKREAKPKLEEENKDDKKEEEKQDDSPKDETTEAAEGDEATGGDTTVEVQVENGEYIQYLYFVHTMIFTIHTALYTLDKLFCCICVCNMSPRCTVSVLLLLYCIDGEEKPTDETAAEEAPKDEEETPKDEGGADEAPKDESEITEEPKDGNEATPKEDEEAPKEKGEANEDEIEKVEEPKPETKTVSLYINVY